MRNVDSPFCAIDVKASDLEVEVVGLCVLLCVQLHVYLSAKLRLAYNAVDVCSLLDSQRYLLTGITVVKTCQSTTDLMTTGSISHRKNSPPSAYNLSAPLESSSILRKRPRGRPHGSKANDSPQDERLGLCAPYWAAARTYTWYWIAAARWRQLVATHLTQSVAICQTRSDSSTYANGPFQSSE